VSPLDNAAISDVFSILIAAIVLAYTWLLAPVAPRSAAAVPVLLVIGIAVARALQTGEWGLSPAAFPPALWRAAALTAAGAAAISLAGARLATWHDPGDPWTRLALLIPWGLGQQFALQTVFLREAQNTISKSGGILVAALAFAALHLPNPFLTTATFIGALAWCWLYDRHPNLVPLALSHAVLTLAILYAFDTDTIGGLRVGAAYLARQ
jgi:membrane protease YdiL (CAAX protease family)